MSVITKTIFCEGELDCWLLSKIGGSLTTESVTITKTGGKFKFQPFAEGYFLGKNMEIKNQQYIFLQDRDFDAIPTHHEQLLYLSEKKKIVFLTYRTCIENYLLDAHLIHAYWELKFQEKLVTPSSKWSHKNSPGVEIISTLIENSAQSLQDYQAIRWSLGELIQMTTTRNQLKTTWTGGSEKLPSSLSYQDCYSEAIKLIEEFKASTNNITIKRFDEILAKYQQQFTQVDFWEQKQYLIWFQGKDIQKAMQKQDHHFIPLDDFFKDILNPTNDSTLAELFDFKQYPDLRELAQKIEQFAIS